MKSRRIKKQSTRHIKSVALQKYKKQLSRRRKSIRRGGGPKKSIKASVKASVKAIQGPDIDDVIEEIEKLIKVAEAVPPMDEEISTIINRLINSVGDVQKRKDGIDDILVNFTPYLNPTQKTALNTKKAELEAELIKKGQDESRLLSEQRAREAETQRKIAEREAERKIREAEEKKREEAEKEAKKKAAEAEKKRAEAERKIAAEKAKEAEAEKKRVEEERKRTEAKAKKTEIKIISNKPLPPVPPTSNVETIPPPIPVPTANVETIPPPIPAPITNVDTMPLPVPAPTANVETISPPVPPTSIVETIPLDIKTAWIDTGIFTESQLLQLQSKFTDKSFKSYEQVISMFPSYDLKELFRLMDKKDPSKSDKKSIREYYDFVTRILLFVGILTEHIEKTPDLDFQIVIKGGIAAQILMSEKSNGHIKYKTADIDLLVLPKRIIPYAEYSKPEQKELLKKILEELRTQLQKHAEDISQLIYFILGNPNTISILTPLQSKGNKDIVKLSYNSNPDEPIFVAMMDIDFKIVPEGPYQYYTDSNLQTHEKENYGYYKTQTVDAFIKEKLFYKSYFDVLHDHTYSEKEYGKKFEKERADTKMLIDKFDVSSKALIGLFNSNKQNYYNILYKYYQDTMYGYFKDPTKFKEGETGFRASNILNYSIPDPYSNPPPPPPPKSSIKLNQNFLPPSPPNIESYL